MTIQHAFWRALSLGLAALFSAGCGCLFYSVGIPNAWEIQNDNVVASGWRGLDGIVRYDHLAIGTPEKPWDGRQAFAIVLTNREVLHSADFSLEEIRTICPSNRVYSKAANGWPAGATLFFTPDYGFLFSGSGSLLQFRAGINYSEKSFATLGDESGTARYRVSWRARQLHRLFGTNFTGVSARCML